VKELHDETAKIYFIYMKPSFLISAFIKEKPHFNYVNRMTLEHSNVLRHKPMSTRIKISLATCVVFWYETCDVVIFALQFVSPHEESFHLTYIALFKAYSKT